MKPCVGCLVWRSTRISQIVASLAFASGCLTLPAGSMTVMSMHEIDPIAEQVDSQVEASHCVYFVMGVPIIGSLAPDKQAAEDSARAQVPEGHSVTNLAYTAEETSYIAVKSSCARVTGDVVSAEPR